MMRSSPSAALAALCLALSGLAVPAFIGPAWAVDTGLEVQVHPVSPGSGVLLYPGGEYMRVVPALREPGEPTGPIHLHMPARRGRTASIAPSTPAATPRAAEERPRPAPAPAPRVASAPPPPKAKPQPKPAPSAPPAAASPYVGGPGAASLFGSLPSAPSASPAGPRTASVAPPPKAPAATGSEGLAKQGVILFAHDADAPADSALDSIRMLAGQLNNGMTRTQSRVELMAYGGNKGDKGSDARRLSLKRALAIRQVLIDSGVSSARIDVHAQGGVDDTGPTDRVDVYIRS
jgi:outer membrane protein OmpA-like peptidoglycan-associated protein